MLKLLIFIPFLLSTVQAADCNPEVHVLNEKFFPYPFGKESRTLDYKEFEEIVFYIKESEKNKKHQVTKTEILVCTSDYRLPPMSVTHKNENEHLDLAMQRAGGLKKELNKKGINADVSHKLCGPAFRNLDKNWRFITKEHMNGKYQEAFKDIEKTEGILEMYKAEALINSIDELRTKFPEPFLAKYKPFNGYRLRLIGKDHCSSTHHQIETGKKEGKGTKQ